jgi:hypothetical protein
MKDQRHVVCTSRRNIWSSGVVGENIEGCWRVGRRGDEVWECEAGLGFASCGAAEEKTVVNGDGRSCLGAGEDFGGQGRALLIRRSRDAKYSSGIKQNQVEVNLYSAVEGGWGKFRRLFLAGDNFNCFKLQTTTENDFLDIHFLGTHFVIHFLGKIHFKCADCSKQKKAASTIDTMLTPFPISCIKAEHVQMRRLEF